VICYVSLRPVYQAVTVVSVSVLSCQSIVVPLRDARLLAYCHYIASWQLSGPLVGLVGS